MLRVMAEDGVIEIEGDEANLRALAASLIEAADNGRADMLGMSLQGLNPITLLRTENTE